MGPRHFFFLLGARHRVGGLCSGSMVQLPEMGLVQDPRKLASAPPHVLGSQKCGSPFSRKPAPLPNGLCTKGPCSHDSLGVWHPPCVCSRSSVGPCPRHHLLTSTSFPDPLIPLALDLQEERGWLSHGHVTSLAFSPMYNELISFPKLERLSSASPSTLHPETEPCRDGGGGSSEQRKYLRGQAHFPL